MWEVSLRVRLASQDWLSGPSFSFSVLENHSGNPGFVEIGPTGYYLQFSDSKTLFSAFGPNLTCDALFPNGMHIGPSYDNFQYLSERMDSLAGEGASLIRLRIAPIAYGFEWERAGNYHLRQNLCWDLDQIVEMAGKKGIYLMLAGVFEGMECKPTRIDWTAGVRHHPYSWYEDSLLWMDESTRVTGSYANRPYYGHPYNKFILKQDSEAEYDMDAFWENAEIKALARNRARYAAARWGYATSVAEFAVSSEFEKFELEEGRDEAGAEWLANEYPVWRDWLLDLTDYMAGIASNHIVGNHLATDLRQHTKADGSWGYTPYGEDFWSRDENPIVHVNPYGNWRDRNHIFASRVRKQRHFGKPIWWPETGLSVPCEDGIRLCILEDKVSFHHNLWAMGLSGALPGSHFWGERIYAYGLFRQYRAVTRFFEGEDLHQRMYFPVVQHAHPYWINFGVEAEDVQYVAVNDTLVDFFGLRSSDHKRILGYAQNRSVTWYNFPAPASDLKFSRTGPYAHFDYDPADPPRDAGPTYRYHSPPQLTFSHLIPKASYKVTLWSTTGMGGPIDSIFVETDRRGQLTFSLPGLQGRLVEGEPFLPGAFAFKMELESGSQPDLIQSLELWPNPALDLLTISAFLSEASSAEMSIFDAAGRRIWQQEWAAGPQKLELDLSVEDWAMGMYLVHLQAKDASLVKRFVVGR